MLPVHTLLVQSLGIVHPPPGEQGPQGLVPPQSMPDSPSFLVLSWQLAA
jgi:hypothetical protein